MPHATLGIILPRAVARNCGRELRVKMYLVEDLRTLGPVALA
jgi:hypothetical protein